MTPEWPEWCREQAVPCRGWETRYNGTTWRIQVWDFTLVASKIVIHLDREVPTYRINFWDPVTSRETPPDDDAVRVIVEDFKTRLPSYEVEALL